MQETLATRNNREAKSTLRGGSQVGVTSLLLVLDSARRKKCVDITGRRPVKITRPGAIRSYFNVVHRLYVLREHFSLA